MLDGISALAFLEGGGRRVVLRHGAQGLSCAAQVFVGAVVECLFHGAVIGGDHLVHLHGRGRRRCVPKRGGALCHDGRGQAQPLVARPHVFVRVEPLTLLYGHQSRERLADVAEIVEALERQEQFLAAVRKARRIRAVHVAHNGCVFMRRHAQARACQVRLCVCRGDVGRHEHRGMGLDVPAGGWRWRCVSQMRAPHGQLSVYAPAHGGGWMQSHSVRRIFHGRDTPSEVQHECLERGVPAQHLRHDLAVQGHGPRLTPQGIPEDARERCACSRYF